METLWERLLAIAVGQRQRCWLIHRHREQARSHSFLCIGAHYPGLRIFTLKMTIKYSWVMFVTVGPYFGSRRPLAKLLLSARFCDFSAFIQARFTNKHTNNNRIKCGENSRC